MRLEGHLDSVPVKISRFCLNLNRLVRFTASVIIRSYCLDIPLLQHVLFVQKTHRNLGFIIRN